MAIYFLPLHRFVQVGAKRGRLPKRRYQRDCAPERALAATQPNCVKLNKKTAFTDTPETCLTAEANPTRCQQRDGKNEPKLPLAFLRDAYCEMLWFQKSPYNFSIDTGSILRGEVMKV